MSINEATHLLINKTHVPLRNGRKVRGSSVSDSGVMVVNFMITFVFERIVCFSEVFFVVEFSKLNYNHENHNNLKEFLGNDEL